ncbi:cytochrome b [Acidovorax sp. NCPPB 3859]|uniref:cytochrome b n=1 Tax=Paracidovorax avenae TaxID=80867 RepID=UPI000D200FCD|nr:MULTISPECIES: cytochrome b [Comamonadaceae]AVT13766.1 cytochrome B [Paracidovorax avenae]MDA8448336.1 cytochrome b [Acidovorax sp. GBBC 3297]MDA8457697.1 cytochrome b [Acidovorax sp. GBBC 3333]MDA8462779.1 cytochrome b [Acidovorax sp. GBBC 3332]MDA8467767.1 cytochrome b [Acidovorax sp. GBBC 3299]
MNTPAKYSATLRLLHWSMFALVALAYASINLRKAFERGSDSRLLMVESHFLLGMLVLLLVLPRLLARWRSPQPPIDPPLSAPLRIGAHLGHGLLYAFLIVQPLLGMACRLVSGRGIGLPFTEASIPWPAAWVDKQFAGTLESAHEWLGTAFYWVIGLHIAAALWHALVRRDNALRRMW